MAFQGWPVEALEFYEGLEVDNTKAYWTDHKAVYEDKVRAPMEALLADLAAEFGEGNIFRPYRDVRFSADKSQYKTAMGARLGGGGYVQLSSEGLAAGLGHAGPDRVEAGGQRPELDPRAHRPFLIALRRLHRLLGGIHSKKSGGPLAAASG